MRRDVVASLCRIWWRGVFVYLAHRGVFILAASAATKPYVGVAGYRGCHV